MWFTPQPLLTLPSTSMRDNLALFIFTSTIRLYILPAVSTSTALVCGYCHGAPFAPSPLCFPHYFELLPSSTQGPRYSECI